MERKPSRPRRAITRPFSISLKEGHLYNNRFEILRTAAFGGMSRIYEAIDTETNEHVALKVLTLSKIDDLLIRRFEREIHILRSLRHPNLVRAIDHGATPSGELYLALEWLKGSDLGDVMESREISSREGLEIARGILRGLEVVHQAGIVHRDLKPANIFVMNNSQPPSGIKLLDFGVAKLVDEHLVSNSNRPLTTAGMVVGTPYYMSPEQAQGSENIDHRADLFAVGAALYEILSGERCFSATSALALLVRIATEEPPPIVSVVPDIAPDINNFLVKALKKNPNERFNSAREMESALAKLIASNDLSTDGYEVATPVFEDGTERMEVADLQEDLAQATVSSTEEIEVVTDAAFAQAPSHHDDTMPEQIADGLSDTPSVLIIQLTNFSKNPKEITSTIKDVITSQQGQFKSVRRSLVIGTFETGIGTAARALFASRSILEKLKLSGIDETSSTYLRMSITSTQSPDAPADGLIEQACTQLEFAEPGEVIVDGVVLELCRSDLKAKERRPNRHIVIQYQEQPLGQMPIVNDNSLGELTQASRTEQLEELIERTELSLRQNSNKIFSVSGSLGMGKSQFILDLKDRVDERFPKSTVLLAQCEPHGQNQPLRALTEALKRSCIIRIGENQETRFHKLLQLVPDNIPPRKRTHTQRNLAQLLDNADQAKDGRPPSLPPVDTTGSQRKGILQLHSDLSDFLSDCAKNPALILLIDDAQWCDRSSLEIISGLLERDELPIIVVLMIASNAIDNPNLKLLQNNFPVEQHVLAPLNQEAIAKVAQHQLKQSIDDNVAIRLEEKTGGNPYYLREILHSIAERMSQGEQLLQTIESVPLGLTDLLENRLSRLSPELRELLSFASIFGGHFWEQGLSAIGLEFSRDSISELVREDLIIPVETSRFLATREYAFRNTLLRDLAYNLVDSDTQAQLHQRVAEWLVGVGENDPIILARHYQRAGAAHENREALCIAASAALHSGDPQSALTFIEEGLGGIENQPHSRTVFELLLLKRKALELQGHYELAIETVIQLAKLGETNHQRNKSEFDHSRLLIARGHSSDALRCSRQALEKVDQALADTSHGWLELALGDALQARGDTITACTNYQNCYARAKNEKDKQLITASILRLARIAYSTSDFTQAMTLYKKAKIRYIRDLEDPRGEAIAELGIGATLIMIGDYKNASEHLQQAHAIFGALPDVGNKMLTRVYQLLVQEEQSNGSLTVAEIERVRAELDEIDYRQPKLFSGILLLRKYVSHGQQDKAISFARQLFDTAIRSLPRYVIAIESEMGVAMAQKGETEQGLRHTEAAVARLESQKAIEDDDPQRIYLNYYLALALNREPEMAKKVLLQANKTMIDIEGRLSEDRRVLFQQRRLHHRIRALVAQAS